MSSLFERIGGQGAIDATVDLFYEKVLADPRINHFFADTDMEQQKNHQKRFLAFAFGGLPNYDGRSLTEAHAKLVNEQGLNESHFNAVAENLQSALMELNVPEDLIAEAIGIAASVKDQVLAG